MNVGILLIWIGLFFPAFQNRIMVQGSFSYPDGPLPAAWWNEGAPARIENGRLFVDADNSTERASTVWLDNKLSGNLLVEFDAKIVSSADLANNINCFFLYSDPCGRPLRNSQNERKSGSYKLYHKLNGYIFTTVANGDTANVRFRLRDNPGFELLGENFTNEMIANQVHHFKIVKIGARLQYWVDGKKVIDAIDDRFNPLHTEGIFGFRTWHTTLWFDNLVITQLN
ncbi:MAG: hypothetical protein JXQ80_08755 [Bacteroidales bacterium]|nr:hypothetical protein [Bacteroidales bacterium]